MSLTEAFKEAIYLQGFLQEMGAHSEQKITIYCDNIGAGKLGKNPVFHARTKHIDIRHHFVREVLEEGKVEVEFIPTEEMVADILTKGLPREKHEWCTRRIGIK